jgi:Flp pilus assembly protein TadG
VTAEFATVVPAVILVLACCLSGLQLAGENLRLQDAAATAARSLARGESGSTASAHASGIVPGASLSRSDRGDLVCATVSAPATAAGGLLRAMTLTASSCALGGGR